MKSKPAPTLLSSPSTKALSPSHLSRRASNAILVLLAGGALNCLSLYNHFMSITVAVTNYNAQDHLVRLLPELRLQGFDRILVLDDASTDGSVKWLQKQTDIELIAGSKNLGPTGNRNRILGTNINDIVVFIDVDMELRGQNLASALKGVFNKYPDAAVAGPLILGQTDEPMWYNWGYELNPKLDGLTDALSQIALAHWHNPEVMATVRAAASGKVGHFEPVKSRQVDWVVEQIFAVRMDIFRELGGFDPKFRMFHEGPDYCRRARQAGHTIRFTTSITAKHLDLHSGNDKQRDKDMLASTKYYYRKHFGLTEASFNKLFGS